MGRRGDLLRILRHVSIPPIPGILTSRRTASNRLVSTSRRACSPLEDATIPKPKAPSAVPRTQRRSESSSVRRICPLGACIVVERSARRRKRYRNGCSVAGFPLGPHMSLVRIHDLLDNRKTQSCPGGQITRLRCSIESLKDTLAVGGRHNKSFTSYSEHYLSLFDGEF